MTAQELKNAILMRAVQGKLVPQDPNDEPASVLLEKIRVEKEQLMKEKKIKKEAISIIYKDPSDNQHYEKIGKEVKCIEDEIPFEIPEGWEWCRLSDLTIKIGSGSTPTGGKSVYVDSGIKFIRSQNVYNDGLILDGIAFITEEINNKKAGSIVHPSDILLNITGGSIGRCALVPKNFDIANVNQHVMIIRQIDTDLNDFIHMCIISPYIQSMIMSVQVGVSREGLSATKLKDFLIPLPSLKEQHRIQMCVEEMQSYLEIYNECEIGLTTIETQLPEKLKKSILQYAIQGKLVPQDPSDEPASVLLERIHAEKEQMIKEGKIKRDKNESYIYRGSDNSYYEKFADGTEECIDEELPFEIPDSWMWCRLNNLGQIIGGGTPSTSKSEYWDGNIAWLTPADMKHVSGKYVSHGERNISEDGLKNSSSRLMPKGTLLYSSRAPIGYIAIAENDICTNQGFKSLVPVDSDLTNFLYYCLIQRTEEIKSRASGTTFKEISGTEFGKTLIPAPPLNEQKKIITRLESILNTL